MPWSIVFGKATRVASNDDKNNAEFQRPERVLAHCSAFFLKEIDLGAIGINTQFALTTNF